MKRQVPQVMARARLRQDGSFFRYRHRLLPIQRLTIGQLMTIKSLDLKDLAVGSIPVIGLLIVEAAFEGVEIEISAAVLGVGEL